MTAFGLDDGEARAVADRFGVAIEQVRRDHLISHILAALSAFHREQVIFFGGTALARTYLPTGRLSDRMDQRYSDVGSATLRVPTAAAFAAWKTVAWHDRCAPRDLWDLWALAQSGEITTHAAELFVAHGPISNAPQPWMFTSAPAEERWQAQLSAQTRLAGSAAEALQVVADAWARASAELTS